MSPFVPGIALCRRFFEEAVQPALDTGFPGLPYAAALLGPGSDVLGFDTEMSTDHGWGPRVDIFLEPSLAESSNAIAAYLVDCVADQFAGFGIAFAAPRNDEHSHDAWFQSKVLTAPMFSQAYLGIDVSQRLEAVDWLTLPSQKLRTLTVGPIFYDAIGLEAWRSTVAWYPNDVWLYLLAAQWTRIGQDEHLMGRAGEAGDELGSAIVGARLVRDLMRLCFLMERRFAPYAKWFGSAFRQLQCADAMIPALEGALASTSWRERERALTTAFELVARMHNELAVTDHIIPMVQPFFSRPFASIATRGFADGLTARIRDPEVQRLLTRPRLGGIDQISDNTDLLESPELRAGLRGLYVSGSSVRH